MSTDLAIAAVKAQALWDAGEQLRRQAAELHPEFQRLLDAPEFALANARGDIEMYQEWSNEIAAYVPERYEVSEGAQEACISAWLVDVMADLTRFRTALQRIAATRGAVVDQMALWNVADEALTAEASGEMTAEERAEEEQS